VATPRQLSRHTAVPTAEVEEIGLGGDTGQNAQYARLQPASAGRERPGQLLIEFSIQLDKLLRNCRFHELIIEQPSLRARRSNLPANREVELFG
jgi:hypothetical protein